MIQNSTWVRADPGQDCFCRAKGRDTPGGLRAKSPLSTEPFLRIGPHGQPVPQLREQHTAFFQGRARQLSPGPATIKSLQMNDARLVFSLRGSEGCLHGHEFIDEDLRSVPESCVSLELENSAITDKGIKALPELPNLRCLDLDSTAITDEAMGRISTIVSLEELWIEDTKITDVGFLLLRVLPKLTFLSILDCDISDDAVKTFKVSRPDVILH